jgi:hypothetical protein
VRRELSQDGNTGIAGRSNSLSGCYFENGEEPFSCDRWEMWVGISLVEKNGFFHTVKIRRAIWTLVQVLPDFPTIRSSQASIELILNMPGHFATEGGMFVYSFHEELD